MKTVYVDADGLAPVLLPAAPDAVLADLAAGACVETDGGTAEQTAITRAIAAGILRERARGEHA